MKVSIGRRKQKTDDVKGQQQEQKKPQINKQQNT
jgi:hypothetical protein